MKKHYTIPFFIIHEGCPHQCIFCDQKGITGKNKITPGEIEPTIKSYLSTMPEAKDVHVEVGFFGGTFTSLPLSRQEEFLKAVQSYIASGKIKGIRLSTRPDSIDSEKLSLLKKYNVGTIELGVQSMSDKVLKASARGHTKEDTIKASKLILEKGFTLAHQMMLGLPESTEEDEYYTALQAKKLGATEARIYPLLVIKNTPLADQWKNKKYMPLEEGEAIKRSANLILYFELSNITVLRCGLHASKSLMDGEEYLAGPFHQSFRQRCESYIFSVMLKNIFNENKKNISKILFNPKDEPYIFGYKSEKTDFNKDLFAPDKEIPKGGLIVHAKSGIFQITRQGAAMKILPEALKC